MPEELTDEAGEIVWEGSYQLWGKPIQEIAHTEIQQNLRYQGQYLDRETGLHYNIFRYYDPDTGRFTQPDPIGLAGGFNLYQYAPNSLNWLDPLGLSCSYNSKSKRWHDNETGRFTKRPTNPADLVNKDGRINMADIEAWAKQGGIPNTWTSDPSRFPNGGFKYRSGKYQIHGHGIDPKAQIEHPGSNAANMPTVRITDISNKNWKKQEVFTIDGEWVKFKGNENRAHIPLDGSNF